LLILQLKPACCRQAAGNFSKTLKPILFTFYSAETDGNQILVCDYERLIKDLETLLNVHPMQFNLSTLKHTKYEFPLALANGVAIESITGFSSMELKKGQKRCPFFNQNVTFKAFLF
jgi:hypothetical protein